jgi:hypothetical protein
MVLASVILTAYARSEINCNAKENGECAFVYVFAKSGQIGAASPSHVRARLSPKKFQ